MNEGGLGDEKHLVWCVKKPSVLKHIPRVCFNTHIGNSVFDNLGAVVGYGLPLQGRCLEEFDSLGLHQNVSRWCNGSIRVSKTLGGSSSLSRDATQFIPSSPSW